MRVADFTRNPVECRLTAGRGQIVRLPKLPHWLGARHKDHVNRASRLRRHSSGLVQAFVILVERSSDSWCITSEFIADFEPSFSVQ